jgi:flavin reductase
MSIANPALWTAGADVLRDDFRAAMRRLASTVAVVTCRREDEWAGMAATSVTSLSMDPPSILVCVNRGARFRGAIRQGSPFTVNLLDRRHEPVSVAFGGAQSGPDRFGVGRWRAGESGVPWLEDGVAAIDCVVDGEVEYGTHSIIIGLVRGARVSGAATPLIYLNGQYQ